MTEITFNQSPADAAVKVLIATKEEALNYGVAGGIVSRALFNQLKALVEREDAAGDKKEILVLDTVKETVVLLRPSNTVGEAGLQVLGGKLYGRLRNFGSAAVFARRLPKTDFDAAAVAANLGLGIELESYSFDKYRTTKSRTNTRSSKPSTLLPKTNWIRKVTNAVPLWPMPSAMRATSPTNRPTS